MLLEGERLNLKPSDLWSNAYRCLSGGYGLYLKSIVTQFNHYMFTTIMPLTIGVLVL